LCGKFIARFISAGKLGKRKCLYNDKTKVGYSDALTKRKENN
jgi:hypothetical protein